MSIESESRGSSAQVHRFSISVARPALCAAQGWVSRAALRGGGGGSGSSPVSQSLALSRTTPQKGTN